MITMAFGLSAFAAPIEVDNYGFEDPVLGAGGWISNDLAPEDLGWQSPAEPNLGDRFVEFIGGFFSEGNQHI